MMAYQTLTLAFIVLIVSQTIHRVSGLPVTKSAKITGQSKHKSEVLDSQSVLEDLHQSRHRAIVASNEDDYERVTISDRDKDGARAINSPTLTTGKILKFLRREKRREEIEKRLLRHRLYLFQKPLQKQDVLGDADVVSVQDFLSYISAVTQHLRLHPNMAQAIVKYYIDCQEQNSQEECITQTEESLVTIQNLQSSLQSVGSRLSKRGANEQKLIFQILNSLRPVLHLEYDMKDDNPGKKSNSAVSVGKHTSNITVLVGKHTALKNLSHENSLPKLPVQNKLMVPSTASTEDIPTTVPPIATTQINGSMRYM